MLSNTAGKIDRSFPRMDRSRSESTIFFGVISWVIMDLNGNESKKNRRNQQAGMFKFYLEASTTLQLSLLVDIDDREIHGEERYVGLSLL
jgi:hypothetical protein